MGFLHLESQLAFYKAYHSNPTNVAIHVVFVPTIAASLLLLLTNTPNLVDIPHFPINASTILAVVYLGLYILMEPVAGFLLSPIVLGGVSYLNKLHVQDAANSNNWAIIAQVVGWAVQFIGHGFFEGRQPALFDNLAQALFLAPFFVWFELLFALGYRPELQSRIQLEVNKKLKQLNAARDEKKSS